MGGEGWSAAHRVRAERSCVATDSARARRSPHGAFDHAGADVPPFDLVIRHVGAVEVLAPTARDLDSGGRLHVSAARGLPIRWSRSCEAPYVTFTISAGTSVPGFNLQATCHFSTGLESVVVPAALFQRFVDRPQCAVAVDATNVRYVAIGGYTMRVQALNRGAGGIRTACVVEP